MTIESQATVTVDRLAEYFCATKSKARLMLIFAIYASQSSGFVLSQGTYTTQVLLKWSREIEAPLWATKRNLCKVGAKIEQGIELTFTGRESLSILLRVYRGHICRRTDWQNVSMKRAMQVLQDPAGLIDGR